MEHLKSPHSLPTPSDVALSYCQQILHPVTQTTDRYVVGDRFHDRARSSGHKEPTCKFHNMRLCREVTQYQSVVSEVINSKIKTVRLQSSSQQNMHHYFFYFLQQKHCTEAVTPDETEASTRRDCHPWSSVPFCVRMFTV